MVRKTLITCLLLCSCFGLHAEDRAAEDLGKTAAKLADAIKASRFRKSDAKTLEGNDDRSQLKKAVHVNSEGIDTRSTSTALRGAVNRLRSVRESIFLPPPTQAQSRTRASGNAASKVVEPKATTVRPEPLVNTSRRKKNETPATPATTFNDSTQATPVTPKLPTSTAARKVLPSVITRRGTPLTESDSETGADLEAAEPRFTPTKAEPTLATPQLATPQLATPKSPASLDEAPSTQAAAPGSPAPLQLLDIVPRAAERSEPGQTPQPADASRVASRTLPQGGSSSVARGAGRPMKLEPGGPYNNINLDSLQAESSVQTTPPTSLAEDTHRVSPSAVATTDAGDSIELPDDLLLANRSPVLIIKTHGQPTIRVGRSATYYITAENAGDLSAEDVVVSVNVPSWAELAKNQASSGLVRVEPNSHGDNLMKWSIRDLQPSTKHTLRIDMIPRASRPIDLGVTWNFKSVSAMAQIEVQEAKLKMSVVGPADIQYGDTKLYTITISNPGTGDAENVVLTLLPIAEGGGPAGVRELGDIKSGTRRTVEVELTARQAGDLAVRAKATADGGLTSQGEQKVHVRRANLAVEAVGPAKRYAGTSARYAIKVINNGDAIARDILTTVTLPPGAKYEKSSGGGEFDSERGKVRWNIGSLRPGGFQIVELTTKLMSAGANRLEVRSSAEEHLSAVGDVQTEVKALADLKLYVDDPAGVVPVGTEVMYDVRIVNRGTRAAHHVNVIGYFSEGIEPVSVQGWKGNVEVGQVALDTIPRIAPGQEIVVKVVAEANRAGDHVFRAEVHAKDPATKLAVDEWTRFDRGDEVQSLGGPVTETAREGSERRR